MRPLKFVDCIVILGLLIWIIVPDPTDILDFGLPIIEAVSGAVYFVLRRKL